LQSKLHNYSKLQVASVIPVRLRININYSSAIAEMAALFVNRCRA